MEPKSLYAQYVAEREGKSIIEEEYGFATYQFHDNFVYLVDVYVVPDKRCSGLGARFLSNVEKIAKGKGYNKVITTVSPKASGSTESLKAILACGFKLVESNTELIYFEKELF